MALPAHPSHLAAVHAGSHAAVASRAAASGSRPLVHRQLTVSQQTDTPDINLERDVIPLESVEAVAPEVLLGMEASELGSDRRLRRTSTGTTTAQIALGTSIPQTGLGTSTARLGVSPAAKPVPGAGVNLYTASGAAVTTLAPAAEEKSDEFADDRFKVNISTILISALLFLLILAWFDFIQSAFYDWLSPEYTLEDIPPSVKLWYALLITVFVLILVYLVYYYSRDYLK